MRQSPALAQLRHRRRAALLRPHDAPAGDLFVSFIARTSAYANGNRLGMVGPSLYAPYSRGSVRLDPKNPERRAAGRFQSPRRSARRRAPAPRRPVRPRAARGQARARRDARGLRAAAQSAGAAPQSARPVIRRPRPCHRGHGRRFRGRRGGRRSGACSRPAKLLADIASEARVLRSRCWPARHRCSIRRAPAPWAPSSIRRRVSSASENCAWSTPRSCRSIPRGNTNIPTLMLAEKCAAQILGERRVG